MTSCCVPYHAKNCVRACVRKLRSCRLAGRLFDPLCLVSVRIVTDGAAEVVSNQVVVKETSTDRVAGWSDTEVRTWLSSLAPALASYSDAFASASVTGKELLTLQDADLEAMGVSSRVHRVRLLKEINRLQN